MDNKAELKMRRTTEILSYRFKYSGEWRHVDNVTFEGEWDTLIGMEIRKSGKFSWKIKRYAMEKIESDLQRIPIMGNQKHYDKMMERMKWIGEKQN